MSKFDGKAVFVVGAGASAEFNLPTGRDLKKQITAALTEANVSTIHRGPDNILGFAMAEAAQHNGLHLGAMERAAQLIARAMPQVASIDNFLHMHRGERAIELCGKLAIVKIILDAEANSRLTNNHDASSIARFDFAGVEETWANWLVRLLCTGCASEDLESRFKQLALVIFNYDRCVEYFLFQSLLNVYGHAMSTERAGQLVKSLEIYHPYGAVGTLEFMAEPGVAPTSFGTSVGSEKVRQLASNIKTFTEGTDPNSSDVVKLRETVRGAARLVFLGFGYAEQNLDLLFGPPSGLVELSKYSDCLGTCSGMSWQNVEMAKVQLKQRGMRGNIALEDTYCGRFLQDNEGPLSFG